LVNWNKLTIPYLKKLAKECNIILKSSSKKADKIATILNAGIPKTRLEEVYNKYLAQYQASKRKPKVTKKKTIRQAVKLEKRINLLEEQVKFIMSKIDSFEVYLAKERSTKLIGGGYNISDIQNVIKLKVLPGDSISIDEIISITELQKYPINLIDKAIIDLIDDEIFDVSEGRSVQKIQGNIGRLIRR